MAIDRWRLCDEYPTRGHKRADRFLNSIDRQAIPLRLFSTFADDRQPASVTPGRRGYVGGGGAL
jgi:hypothetical protein